MWYTDSYEPVAYTCMGSLVELFTHVVVFFIGLFLEQSHQQL